MYLARQRCIINSPRVKRWKRRDRKSKSFAAAARHYKPSIVIVGGGFSGIAAAKRYDIATPKSLNRPEMLSAFGRHPVRYYDTTRTRSWRGNRDATAEYFPIRFIYSLIKT
jgi:hypothetical protein